MDLIGGRRAWHALAAAVALPFSQAWTEVDRITADDDWSGVAGLVGHRGDGLTAAPGTDPRLVVADGSGTPLDVNADETDPLAVGLAGGVAEFELADPVVALQGSATAAAPHLLLSLDTRVRAGLRVSYRLRDLDASTIADADQAVAVQYRVGGSGEFTPVAGGFVADATTGPGKATLVTPVSAPLPAAVDDRPLVQLRVISTNAQGQDEWVGVDDIEVTASERACTPSPPAGPPPAPPPPDGPPAHLLPTPGDSLPGAPREPRVPAPQLTGLALRPGVFKAASRGPAIAHSGRAGTSLSFRLSRTARVRFTVPNEGRFNLRARRGLNLVRFSGRLRGRRLPAGAYRLVAVALPPHGQPSAPASVAFRIRQRRLPPAIASPSQKSTHG